MYNSEGQSDFTSMRGMGSFTGYCLDQSGFPWKGSYTSRFLNHQPKKLRYFKGFLKLGDEILPRYIGILS